MPRSVSRSVRYLFVVFAAALLLLAGVQSFGRAGEPRMGLSTCGGDDTSPCVIEGLTVTAEPAIPADDEVGLVQRLEKKVPVETLAKS